MTWVIDMLRYGVTLNGVGDFVLMAMLLAMPAASMPAQLTPSIVEAAREAGASEGAQLLESGVLRSFGLLAGLWGVCRVLPCLVSSRQWSLRVAAASYACEVAFFVTDFLAAGPHAKPDFVVVAGIAGVAGLACLGASLAAPLSPKPHAA